MFDIVRLQRGESPRAFAALGLKVKRGAFAQPCAALDGLRCTIYADRPVRCRLFECRQLKRIAAGETTEAAAMEKIRDVQRRLEEIIGLLAAAGSTNIRKAIAHRCASLLAEPLDSPDNAALREKVAASMKALDRILEADFRTEPRIALTQLA